MRWQHGGGAWVCLQVNWCARNAAQGVRNRPRLAMPYHVRGEVGMQRFNLYVRRRSSLCPLCLCGEFLPEITEESHSLAPLQWMPGPASVGRAGMEPSSLASFIGRLRRIVEPWGGGLDDAELLKRFTAERDEAAFEVLLWRYGP